jgi:DNA-binding CsgD family transcriptional regulator
VTTAGKLMSDADLRLIAMLARGYTTTLAARELHLSPYTVSERISLLLDRYGCKNRAELVAYCYVHGHLSVLAWPPCRCQCAPRRDVNHEPTSSRNGSSGGG